MGKIILWVPLTSWETSRLENNEVASQGQGVKVNRYRLLIRTSKSLPRSGRLGQN